MKPYNNARILLHACCAPCSTVAIEKLADQKPVIFWYNPNIEPRAEHDKRLATLKDFAKHAKLTLVISDDYELDNKKWHSFVKSLEEEKEGGKRCERCFLFRLQETARASKKNGYDYFTTSLTVSPYKNSNAVNAAGGNAEKENAIPFLEMDLKKQDGYKRSIELSKGYNLYRQSYCGCRYSNKDN